MPQTLLDIVTGLEPELRRRLSQGSVDFANGEAAVRLSFLLFTALRGHVATIAIPRTCLRALPRPVLSGGPTSAVRWPARRRTIPATRPGAGKTGRPSAIQMDLQDPRGKRPGTHRLD
jgi:hypothetical protein